MVTTKITEKENIFDLIGEKLALLLHAKERKKGKKTLELWYKEQNNMVIEFK